MVENEILNNEGVVETLEEVGQTNGNILPVVIVGAVIAAGIATVIYIKKKKAKTIVLNTVVAEKTVDQDISNEIEE